MKADFTVHHGQGRLLKDTIHRDLGICAGIGYGKSDFGPKKAERARKDNPKSKTALVIAPTFRLLRKICLEKYISFLKSTGMREGRKKAADFWVNYSDLTIHFRSGQETIFVSASDVNAIVAYTAYFAWIDEAALCSREVARRVLMRLRCPNAWYRQRLFTFTPEGVANYLYEIFEPSKHERNGVFSENERRLLLHGSSFDNPYLDDEFRNSLIEEFAWDTRYYQNYVLGLWVSLAKNAFYFAFDQTKHVGNHPFIPELREFDISMDYNVGKMAWCALQQIGSIFRVFHANRADGRNVDEVCQQIVDAFPPDEYRDCKIRVWGDATGHNRSTLSYDTGYEQVEAKLKPLYPRLSIEAHLSNPFVEERSRCTNKLFANSRLYIDRSCTSIITSANTAETDIRRGIKKPKNDEVTHPMEALDMALINLDPSIIVRRGTGVSW